jgi:type IV pilus assembly protein PilA
MQRRLRDRQNGEDGFTLIELMVVVMIIAILLGIAIPAFLGAKSRAQDTAAKSNLRNALATAQTRFSDQQIFGPVDGTATSFEKLLATDEPSLTWIDGSAVTGVSTGDKAISVDTNATDTIYLAAWSKGAKKCWWMRHVNASGATGGSFIVSASAADNTGCSAKAGETRTDFAPL